MARLKDSGRRRDFDTGSVRDTDAGKGAFHLLPFHALLEFARHMRDGGDKYGWRNWELGQPVASYLNSAIRHLYEWLAGYRDEPHLRAAAWNVMAALETRELVRRGRLPEELMDEGSDGEYSLRPPLDPEEAPIEDERTDQQPANKRMINE